MRPIYFLDDLFNEIPSLSRPRKLAVAFAIYTDLTLNQVKRLKWSDNIVDLPWQAVFILDKLPRSHQIDNVFYDKNGSEDVEMISLPFVFGIATLWTEWSLFAAKYKTAMPIELSIKSTY